MLNSRQFPKVDAEKLHGQLASDGGFTENPRTGRQPQSGFMVAQVGHERKTAVPDSSPQTVADFADAPEHAPALGKGAAMLGGWREEGHDYLDVTQRFPAHVEGHQAAREATLNRDQMAYFDRSNFTSGYNPWHGANNFGGMTAPEQSPEQVRNWTTAVGERKGRSRRVAWTDDDRKTHVNERAVRNPGSFS